MKSNRLDGVLMRNRKYLLLDIALAAFFLIVLVFAGIAFGSVLPELAPGSARAVEMDKVADGAPTAMAASESSRTVTVQ